MEPLIQFCEEKYGHNDYISEYYNTISNISYIIAGLMINYNGGNKLIEKNIYLIGFGSALFHGTSSYIGEFFDEIFILLAVCDIIMITGGRNYLFHSLCIYLIGMVCKQFLVFYFFLTILSVNAYYLFVKKYGVTERVADILIFLVLGKICWYLEHHFDICEFHPMWHILSSISLYHVGMLLR